MQIQSFNSELAIANLMFLRLFNNIIIHRTDKQKNKKQVKVNCVFGQRSRILKNFQNQDKTGNMKLPMIAINRTGYVRNGERVNDNNNEVKFEITSKNRSYDLLTPIPIDISYDVVIIAKYPSDVDQIASNFMVFFNPSIYVTCEHPKYEGIKLNNQIVMSDSISEEHPDELDGATDDFITTTFQFTFKTYLFGGNTQAKLVPQKIISTYISSVISDCVYELTNEDKQNLSNFVDKNLSTTYQKKVDVTLTAFVDNPNISNETYDGFVPIVKSIDAGFYPVPQVSDFVQYMDDVDKLDTQWPYVDRISWTI